MTKSSQPHSGNRRRKKRDQIDVAALFKKPIEVSIGGRKQKITAYEAGLHALVKKAVKDGNLNAINTVLGIASKFDLLKSVSVPKNSGVRISPVQLTKEQFEKYEKAKADGLLTPEDQNKLFLNCDREKN